MAHTVAQPGLHAHSWRPEDDLMKRFVIERSLGEGKGWLAVSSRNLYEDAFLDAGLRRLSGGVEHRVRDQFAK